MDSIKLNSYEEVKNVVSALIEYTDIPDNQQNTIAEYITNELMRKIDFYTRKFYMIVTKDGRFIRYGVSSSGSKEVFLGLSASSATVFDDIVSSHEVLIKCKIKYPSEVFLIESFEY